METQPSSPPPLVGGTLESPHDAKAVIDAGHPPVAAKVALVDYDGTLFPFGQLMPADPEPLPGAVDGMRALRAAGYRIGIFTSRLSRVWHRSEGWPHDVALQEQSTYITNTLDKLDIPWDFMTAEKVPSEVYFDDKAIRVSKEVPLGLAIQQFLEGK